MMGWGRDGASLVPIRLTGRKAKDKGTANVPGERRNTSVEIDKRPFRPLAALAGCLGNRPLGRWSTFGEPSQRPVEPKAP